MRLRFTSQTTINAPASQVWRVVAHEFSAIGDWASTIPHSQAVADRPALAGAEVCGRICSTNIPGITAVREQFTYYDEQAMRFGYAAADGLPALIRRAENNWQVRSLGSEACIAEAWAELELPLLLGVCLVPLMKLQLSRAGARLLEELKYYVEHEQPHPRKLKARQRAAQQAAARSR
jgi:hypothetical protein